MVEGVISILAWIGGFLFGISFFSWYLLRNIEREIKRYTRLMHDTSAYTQSKWYQGHILGLLVARSYIRFMNNRKWK